MSIDELSSRDRRSTQYYQQGDRRAKNYKDTSYSILPMKEYKDQTARSYEIDDGNECMPFSRKIKEVPIPDNFVCLII